jgi:hypothetical protein
MNNILFLDTIVHFHSHTHYKVLHMERYYTRHSCDVTVVTHLSNQLYQLPRHVQGLHQTSGYDTIHCQFYHPICITTLVN